jgi:thiosulfate/3-mercaptopyruvate sulfurtransferase
MLLSSVLIETHDLATWSAADYCVVETDRIRDAFDAGHVPGSVFWPMTEFFTPEFRLRTEPGHIAELLSQAGITPETTIVCSYNGDPTMSGWAAWLFWILTGFGHSRTVVLNGGTPKWRREGRPLEKIEAKRNASSYPTPSAFDNSQRATLAHVKSLLAREVAGAILDARSEEEFHGEHFFDSPPTDGQRAGHIPGARHLPYYALLQEDGTYRIPSEMRSVCGSLGVDGAQQVVTYCAVGIRSSLLWFALKHLLLFPEVQNYDGSWNEWSRVEAKKS